ncbi:helix-turn-helix domain-containing protein [Dyadobacter pollutisoli]|uniref:Helix-turn-helix transcriptional regulator n=1 Tax=Dyadobacter pollutisoli TaxID=2910158 RepID=A0A9E8NCE1_9BACT|nr:helix-turn-helix transcriptional regulator [Dyadobacter pollutisoli]WAC12427.1 helix-turn-helix transcriptional regulator [Dyadobacter pollutisoli]
MQSIFPTYTIGHFINEPDSSTEFELMRFEQMEEPNVDDPHKHTFYEILWIDAGISRQAIDYAEYELKPQSLFFISPGQLHFFEEWEHLAGGSILFTEDFFLLNHQDKDKLFELSFLDNFYANPLLQLAKEDFDEIRHMIELLGREKQRKDSSAAICQSLLHVLLGQIQRRIETQAGKTTASKYVILYKKLKNLLDQHYRENRSVRAYAADLSITQHHLNLICKQVTGKTASEVIRSRSLLEAKRLLTFTQMTVSEVATQLGFFDPSYFARVFRDETGLSPTAFKQVMSEKYPL